uniref:Nitroreductase n=1 Tax=uncultured Chloroflexota bacterium TaxID=166587 RepID=H5S8Q2_9CHLR|nr:nitroreductase [uncultured Chloroflexota bacterium]
METPKDLLAFLCTRRTIRRFRLDPVPPDLVEQILQVAVYAPSAHNLQPWRFVLLESAEAREKLAIALTSAMQRDMRAEGATEEEIQARLVRSQRRLREAPVVILLCRDRAARRSDRPEEDWMGLQSVAAAGLQLLLAAHALGLGGNWICWPLYAPVETRQALDLPEDWQPEALFFLGYPAELPSTPIRAVTILHR